MCSINKTLDELIRIAKAQISTSDGPYVTAPDRAYLTVRACSEVRWALVDDQTMSSTRKAELLARLTARHAKAVKHWHRTLFETPTPNTLSLT